MLPSPWPSIRTVSWLAVGMTAPVMNPRAAWLPHQVFMAARAPGAARARKPASLRAARAAVSLPNRAPGNISAGSGAPVAVLFAGGCVAAECADDRRAGRIAMTAAATTTTASRPPK